MNAVVSATCRLNAIGLRYVGAEDSVGLQLNRLHSWRRDLLDAVQYGRQQSHLEIRRQHFPMFVNPVLQYHLPQQLSSM